MRGTAVQRPGAALHVALRAECDATGKLPQTVVAVDPDFTPPHDCIPPPYWPQRSTSRERRKTPVRELN
jgi:hypothetical protein